MTYQKTKQLLSAYYVQFYFAGLTKGYPWWLDTHNNDTWSGTYTMDCDTIFYIMDGEFELTLRHEVHRIRAGELVYLPAGTTYTRSIIGEQPLRKYYCTFNLSLGKDSLSHCFKIPTILQVGNDPTLVRLFEELIRFHHSDDQPFAAIGGNGVLLQLISFVLKQSDATFIARTESSDLSMQEIQRYIHTHLFSSLSTSELASIAGYSIGHFTKLFKRTFGCLPQEYIATVKTNRAKKRLRETHLSMTALAEEFGFCDASYFGKFFKKQTGMSPSTYRKSIKFKI